jgi:hypothetical protein
LIKQHSQHKMEPKLVPKCRPIVHFYSNAKRLALRFMHSYVTYIPTLCRRSMLEKGGIADLHPIFSSVGRFCRPL